MPVTNQGSILNCRRFHLQLLAAITLVASMAVLTSCSVVVQQVSKSSGKNMGDTASTAVNRPITLREKLEAGTGTFNRDDPNFKLFDPCKEISPEAYKKLGWEQDELSYLELREAYKMISCNLFSIDEQSVGEVVGISNDALPYSHIDELGLIISDLDREIPDGFYLHGPISPMEGYCVAAVETNSGRLNIAYASSSFLQLSLEENCQKAVDFLSQILDLEV